jgi:hypothetical protein
MTICASGFFRVCGPWIPAFAGMTKERKTPVINVHKLRRLAHPLLILTVPKVMKTRVEPEGPL